MFLAYYMTSEIRIEDYQYNTSALRLRLARYRRFTTTHGQIFPKNMRKERGLFSALPEHNPIRPGRINGGGSAFNPASTKPRHRLVLSWSRPRAGFDISITRFGIEATSNSMPPASPSLRPGRFDVLSSSVVEERRGWETRWCRRRGPINQSGRETRGGRRADSQGRVV